MSARRKAQFVGSPTTTEDDEPTQNDPSSDFDDTSLSRPITGPRKSKGKRRASAVFADTSNGDIRAPLTPHSDSPSNPLKRPLAQKKAGGFTEVDDRAEKRKRRKSARVSFKGPSEEDSANAIPGEMSGSDLKQGDASPARDSATRPRLSSGGPQRINAVAPSPLPVVSIDVMNSNFEEWMKMATDNKINATNSWNFALIDYFHDMSLLRNTDDNSINFQKASFTLDGCVKIWTSRVDSVGTETGKLLSNLAQENGKDNVDDGEEEGGGDIDGEHGEKGGKRRVHRTEATLAKSYSQLQVKKLDLDFAVDPLFRKTRAEFDEGGAMGLLMNHLGVDSKMRVVFDSGGSNILDEEEEEPDMHQTIDLTDIRANFLPSLDTLETRSIAQDLSGFRFSSDPKDLDFTFIHKPHDEPPDHTFDSTSVFGNGDGDRVGEFAADSIQGGADAQDFFTGEQAVHDDAHDSGGLDFGNDYDGEDVGPSLGGVSGVSTIGGMEPFDPRRAPNERDLVMAMNDDDENMLDYFDSNFMRNWAGPEHWKLRRPVKKPEATNDAPKLKREKVVFKIAFLDPPEQTAKQMFVAASKPSMIVLPAKSGATSQSQKALSKGGRVKKAVKRDHHLLPDDMHFTSQQLLRLFLKPKFTLKMRRYGTASGQLDENGDGEVDQHFWAQANQNGGDDIDQTQGGGPIPFNTQFFHDDFDDGPGFDDDVDPDGGELVIPTTLDEEGDLLAATQGPLKRVRPEFVNYARKAKRVDVRKLKDNIWKGLQIMTPSDVEPGDDGKVPEDSLTDPTKPRKFESVIQDLRKSYTQDKMEEISTSFCFICLLHLANERGLKIEVGKDCAVDDDSDRVEERDRSVGDIWSLKVFRDPTASASA